MDKHEMMRLAVGERCCSRHAALEHEDGAHGPLTRSDLDTLTAVAHGAVVSGQEKAFAGGAVRAVLVLAAALAESQEVAAAERALRKAEVAWTHAGADEGPSAGARRRYDVATAAWVKAGDALRALGVEP